MWYMKLLERNLIPEPIIRFILRKMLRNHNKNEPKDITKRQNVLMNLVIDLQNQPIAIVTEKPNEQHYELPSEFFKKILGNNMKYSCCFWNDTRLKIKSNSNLTKAEIDMLELYIQRAGISDGQRILDLGCGWGSLSLYLAEKFPKAKIWSLSNSKTQIEFIEQESKKRNFQNISTIKANIVDFTTELLFDRIISIEMFEHMRNYHQLLEKLASFLDEEGKLFIHIFTREDLPYLFDHTNKDSWMSKYFFAGGTMPSTNLLLYFQKDFRIMNHWKINGLHYTKTLNSWLWKMKKNKKDILPIIEKTYGKENRIKWWVFWKMFFIINAEVFGWSNGSEWFVSHYLFEKRI